MSRLRPLYASSRCALVSLQKCVNFDVFEVILRRSLHKDSGREGGDIGLFIILVPKVLNNVFLAVGLTTLGASNLDILDKLGLPDKGRAIKGLVV